MRHSITCLNGRFLRADRARLPLADRGFRFGDGVFETIRLEQGVPYQWGLHLNRLAQGLTALRIAPPDVDWRAVAQKIIRKNRAISGFLRISISRGVGSSGYLPSPAITPNWAMEYIPAQPLPTAPYRLWLSRYTRAPLSVLPGNQKLAQGITSTLALLEAQEHGCEEALLLASDSTLCSAAAATIFWIKGETVFTPPLSSGCLQGTTRHVVLTMPGINMQEQPAPLAALADAEAVFIANCRLGLWPVVEIEPGGFGYKVDHEIFLKLTKLYRQHGVDEYRLNRPYWKSYS